MLLPCTERSSRLQARLDLFEQLPGERLVSERAHADRDRAGLLVLSFDRDLDALLESRLRDDRPVEPRGVLRDDVDLLVLEDALRCFDHFLRSPGHRAV